MRLTPARTMAARNFVPVITGVVAGDGQATVSFTTSFPTSYVATSSPGGLTASGSSSPLTVTGLTNGVSYTFTVSANGGVSSAASGSVTPVASTHTLTAEDEIPGFPGLGGVGLFYPSGPGSISPTTYSGYTIQAFFSSTADGTWFRTSTTGNPTLFTSITSNSMTLYSAGATFDGQSWNWPSNIMFTVAGSYPVTIT